MQKTILFLHGMGGSNNGTIPKALKRRFEGRTFADTSGREFTVRVVSPLYDFDPDKAHEAITGLVEMEKPDLVVAMSLGSLHALGIHGMPHIYVSPAINAGATMSKAVTLMSLTGGLIDIDSFLKRKTSPDRQLCSADPEVLRRYLPLQEQIWQSCDLTHPDRSYGIFATDDIFRKAGAVSLSVWKKILPGCDFEEVDGANHQFSNFDVMKIVAPKVKEYLEIAR